MTEREELVRTVLQAAGGKITGRIRLQKMLYLLEQLGLGGGFQFSYHNYGPYSEDLARALERATILDKTIQEEKKAFVGGGGFYSIYSLTNNDDPLPEKIGGITVEAAQAHIRAMKDTTSVVIELAATIHWLREKEKVGDWCSELKIRKGSKAQDESINKAEALLQGLGLAA